MDIIVYIAFMDLSGLKIYMYRCVLLLLCLFWPGSAGALDLMLAEVYDSEIDISGWLVSEKLDGVRGYWDGRQLLSKNGNRFNPPAAFTRNFPDFALEGEIWGGRGTFEKTIGVIKSQADVSGWRQLKFAIFDVPETGVVFTRRLEKAKEWFAGNPSDYAFVIPQKPVRNKDELKEELLRVEKLGGEGLIVRKPEAVYVPGRSSEILKVKNYHDAEAVVVGHIPGKGRNAGKLGSLLVELPDGRQFRIGTGLSDAQRADPPPKGTVVTFKYHGLYQSGIPKFPSFLRIRQE